MNLEGFEATCYGPKAFGLQEIGQIQDGQQRWREHFVPEQQQQAASLSILDAMQS
jgi:hypothetical protein